MTDATIGPAQMVLYDGETPIGHVFDYGPGRVLAFHLTAWGKISLGFHRDRRAAREAIEARHRGEQHEAI
jgi:hypothetical protein